MPRIAVLLPTYNPGSELAETLNSLRQQTVPFRLFLVDDGSKRPGDYEDLTKGMDAVILRLPQNLGITGAMNAGLTALMQQKPDYIARIDTGDFCTGARFARQMEFMDANPGVGIVGSAVEFRVFDDTAKMIGSKVMTFPLDPASCAQRLFLNSSIIHPAMLIRREVFEALRGYSEDYPAAEDYDLLWRAHKAGFALMNLPETLLIKEETPGSISQKRRRRQVWSRLRIQWHNRDLTKPICWKGLLRTAVIWALPAWAIHGMKFKAAK